MALKLLQNRGDRSDKRFALGISEFIQQHNLLKEYSFFQNVKLLL